ncbi:related to NUP133 Nuclear pore protein [Rhynchosporium graminicola]|uniref:Related to NUP133 Nuclear pore protein n=1 Tax=Rhynchosporium graminicola TaxID=2792576 RepID=A0A1E1KKI2_9HELO|nr:related to NUP133 Nuclear pore protein [Rhynchosporium commune]
MFSPAANGAATPTVRTSRRRPRPLSNEGSLSIPKGKRQRLNEQTFMPPGAAPEMEETKNSMVATLAGPGIVREPAGLRQDIVVRCKKSRTGERSTKGNGSTVLTSNNTYTVSRLAALPDILRADSTIHQHGAIDFDRGYALTLTHTHAIVWEYNDNKQFPGNFTFALPHASKRTSDPLPLGSLVSNSASNDHPGLVVVIPTSGKITYWESVSSAATLDLKLRRTGVEHLIPGMLSGETVIQVLNAETAGFVLAFSTGRIAYMAVRDGHGRPTISVQFLRGVGGAASGSIFGSIRNALSSSASRGDIAAIRAGAPGKVGERNVVLATAKGKLQCWNIHRSGHATIDGDAEGRDAIVMAIKANQPELNDSLIESFECHDFTYVPKSTTESSSQDPESDTRLLLLTSLKHRNNSHYFLVNVILKDTELSVTDIHPIISYTTPVNRAATSRPRLYQPHPTIAYLVFDRAIVVVSMIKQPDSPDTQLRLEGHLLPQPFEDVIDFRQEMDIEVVGSGMEVPPEHSTIMEDLKPHGRHRAKHPAVVLIVRGGGIIRVAATNTTKLTSRNAPQVDALSKLKQAVFYGGIKDNPLNFKVRPELQFPAEQIATASKELSQEILKSCPPFDSNLAVGQSLQKRTTALRDLAIYLKASGVILDRKTKWELLVDAEKLAAAALMWKRYDGTVRNLPDGQKHGLMADVVEFIHENDKQAPTQEKGELDRVRHWFIKDVDKIQIAVPWAYQVIKYTYQDGQKDHAAVMDILSEADDMVLGAIQGAYDFRIANLKLYGLGEEQLEHGILKSGYEGLDEFWTSTFFVSENLRKQVELAGMLLGEYWGRGGTKGEPGPEVIDKIRLEFPNLIDTAIRSNQERIRWNSAQESQQSHEEAQQLASAIAKVQDEHISTLSTDLELTDEAIALAEKHEILPVLARLLQYELNGNRLRARQPGVSDEDVEFLLDRSEAIKGIIEGLFVKFGAKWANAFFEHEMDDGAMEQLLSEWTEEQTYLTEFLRSKPEYAKVSWINDVSREKNVEDASTALIDLGLNHEQDLWSKKIELSLGKIALLASQSKSSNPEASETKLNSVLNQLGLIKIQDQIFNFVLPSIAAAIDENAEIQLALEAHGNARLRKQHVLTRLLQDSMTRLVKHEAMNASELIDVLTLMGNQAELLSQESFLGTRFFLALEAMRYGMFDRNQQLLLQRIIWRRCMLSDDWAQVNDSFDKDEQQLSDQLKKTAVYQTVYMCFKNRTFENNSNMRPMDPIDVTDAGVSDVEERFSQLDASIKENLADEMQVEVDSLALEEKHRLSKWFNTVTEKAKGDYEAALAEATDEGKSMHQVEAQLALVEGDIKEKERIKADGLLHSKQRYKPKPKTNGHLRQSVRV